MTVHICYLLLRAQTILIIAASRCCEGWPVRHKREHARAARVEATYGRQQPPRGESTGRLGHINRPMRNRCGSESAQRCQ